MKSIVTDLEDAWRDPDGSARIALVGDGLRLSYAELAERVFRVAGWCTENLPSGSRVAIALPNTPEFVCVLYGAVAAGMIAVPIDPSIHPRNLDYLLADSEPALIVALSRYVDSFQQCPWFQQGSARFVSVGEPIEGVEDVDCLFVGPQADARSLDCDEPAVILYSTGTTGLRKGVLLSHRTLTAATRNINEFMRLSSGVTEILPMPMTHSFGFARLRCAFAVRGTVVLVPGMTRPIQLLKLLASHPESSLGLVPAACRMLVDGFRQRFAEAGRHLAFLEIGTDYLDRKYKEALLEMFPATRICMFYGLTEASRSSLIEWHSERQHIDTVGRPAPHVELQVTGVDGRPTATGDVGEIWVRGDTVMSGYWRKPEETRAKLADGWLHTGDLARIDEDGYIRLVGRASDTFKIGGLAVAPAEIEALLGEHPGVSEAGVAPVHDEAGITGLVLHAWVVPKHAEEPLDLSTLRRFCLERLEPYKVPRHFHEIEALPRTKSGKLQRTELAALVARGD